MPLELDPIDRIMQAMETMMRLHSVIRSLDTIKRYGIEAEQIDDVVLAALNASLCLEDDRLARGAPELSLALEHLAQAA